MNQPNIWGEQVIGWFLMFLCQFLFSDDSAIFAFCQRWWQFSIGVPLMIVIWCHFTIQSKIPLIQYIKLAPVMIRTLKNWYKTTEPGRKQRFWVIFCWKIYFLRFLSLFWPLFIRNSFFGLFFEPKFVFFFWKNAYILNNWLILTVKLWGSRLRR